MRRFTSIEEICAVLEARGCTCERQEMAGARMLHVRRVTSKGEVRRAMLEIDKLAGQMVPNTYLRTICGALGIPPTSFDDE